MFWIFPAEVQAPLAPGWRNLPSTHRKTSLQTSGGRGEVHIYSAGDYSPPPATNGPSVS